jgi:hypothetical protein
MGIYPFNTTQQSRFYSGQGKSASNLRLEIKHTLTAARRVFDLQVKTQRLSMISA